MHHQTIWLSSLIFAALASATPTQPRKRFPYPNKGVSYPYPTGTGIYPTGTSAPWPRSIDSTPPSNNLLSTTATHPATGTPTSFKIQYQNTYDDPDAPVLNGFANLTPGSDSALSQAYTDDAALAATFTLNADGSLSVGDLFSDIPPKFAYTSILFQTEETIASQGDFKTYCGLGDGGVLSCSTNTGTYDNDVYYACGEQPGPYSIDAGPTGRENGDGCYTLNLLAVPL